MQLLVDESREALKILTGAINAAWGPEGHPALETTYKIVLAADSLSYQHRGVKK